VNIDFYLPLYIECLEGPFVCSLLLPTCIGNRDHRDYRGSRDNRDHVDSRDNGDDRGHWGGGVIGRDSGRVWIIGGVVLGIIGIVGIIGIIGIVA